MRASWPDSQLAPPARRDVSVASVAGTDGEVLQALRACFKGPCERWGDADGVVGGDRELVVFDAQRARAGEDDVGLLGVGVHVAE